MKIKILLIDDGAGWRGGQRQVYLLARGLKERGHAPMIACRPGDELSKKAKSAGISVFELAMRGEWDALAAWKLGAMAADVDIVHANTSHAHTLALMAIRIGEMRPVVIHRRVDFEPGKSAFNKWKYKSADIYISISRAVSEALKTCGVSEKRIRMVHSGIDVGEVLKADPVNIRTQLKMSPDQPLIGTIGQLVDHKGHKFLIDAAPLVLNEFPDARFAIVGSGKLESDLKKQISAIGLGDKVHLLGWRNDALGILKSFTLFAMPSHLEGMGTAVLDAFAAKIPVVAAEAGGLSEIVVDGMTGYLSSVGDPKSLATAIISALKNTNKSKMMAESAYKALDEKFTADKMVEGVIGVYKELVN